MPRTVGGDVRAEIELLDGEEVRWSKGASRRGGLVAAGGKLFLTDRRLLWTPNWYFERLGVGTITIPLSTVADVAVEERGLSGKLFSVLTAGSSDRLRVETTASDVETWSLGATTEAAERIRAATTDR